jgi:hypothetical protein
MAFFITSFILLGYEKSGQENVSYSGFSALPGWTIAVVSRAAMTDYRPPFSFVIDVLIYKSLGFNSRFVAYLDYVLSIHYFVLSLSIFNIF